MAESWRGGDGDKGDQPLGALHSPAAQGSPVDRAPGTTTARLLAPSWPLIEQLASNFLHDKALLFDHTQVANMAHARCCAMLMIGSGSGPGASGAEIDESWIMDRIVETARELQIKDHQRCREGERAQHPGCERDQRLVSGIGVRPDRALLAAVQFNALPERKRRAFYALAIAGRTMLELVDEEWPTMEELRSDTMDALEILLGRHRDGGGHKKGGERS